MLEHEPPYLIHCELGTARTGFLSAMLESFMEAAFDDMVKDYMLSFVGGDEYSEYDYNNGAERIKNLFESIKGGSIDAHEICPPLHNSLSISRPGVKQMRYKNGPLITQITRIFVTKSLRNL